MSKQAEVLDRCLTKLARGEITLEECLASHPEYAAELPRLLAVVEQLKGGRTLQPSTAFKRRTRAQLIAHINARSARPSFWQRLGGLFLFRFLPAGPVLKVALSLIVVLGLSLTSGTMLAQAAAPGDTLYRWRLTSEEILHTVYPTAPVDLFIAERRARDLVKAAGKPDLEQLALPGYRQSLGWLWPYLDSDSQEAVRQSLLEQRANLTQVNLSPPPELDELFSTFDIQQTNNLPRPVVAQQAETGIQLAYEAVTVSDTVVTYSLVITNQGPASPVTATLRHTLAGGQTLVKAEGADCQFDAGALACAVDNLAINIPRQITIATKITACGEGRLINTATISGIEHADLGNITHLNPDPQTVVKRSFALTFPMYQQAAYVQSNGQTHDLYFITAATQTSVSLHRHAAAPAWSSDGRQLAFFGEAGISNLGGVYAQGNGLWIIAVGPGQEPNPRQLVALDHIKNIVWSPDDSKLAFEVGQPGLAHEVVVVDAGDGQQISRFPGEQPAWKADNQTLAVKGCYPACGLWQFNLDGSQGTQLTFGENDSYPAFSPTGSYLAFSSDREDDWEIYLLRLADNKLQRLTRRPGTDTTPVFGRCGQEIYLRTDHYGDWRLTVMRLDGSSEQTLQKNVGQSNDWGLGRPAIY